MEYIKENASHGQGDGASNIVYLFGKNRIDSKLSPPKKQQVSKEAKEQIIFKAHQKVMEWNDFEFSDSSRWLLSLVSQAYRGGMQYE